ncbi:MAG: hypothetical protein AAGJ68_05750 [Pseudomonadota bacterium]
MVDVIYLGLIVVTFFFAFILSTYLIRAGIPKLESDFVETKTLETDPLASLIREGRLPESSRAGRIFDLKSTGFWIGLTETVLIFILVFAGAFSALAIIIGAKQFVRNEKINLIPSYYLLGTLANLCIAVLFALLAKYFLSDFSIYLADMWGVADAAVDLGSQTQEGA